MGKTEVSVIVATFNPNEKKLLYTLNSILLQKNVEFEIIIADDGSKKFPRKAVQDFFAKKNFENYSLHILEENSGTVRNILKSSKTAKGKYCKLISPGDFLYHYDILRNWVDFMNCYNYDLSYSDAIYYKNIENPTVEICLANPQKTTTNTDKLLKNYLLYNDFFLGAATLIKTSILTKYLTEIDGKVMYAEDNIYRLMVSDQCSIGYYPEASILYEFGEGISTKKTDFWNTQLKKDLKETNLLLLKRQLPKYIVKKLEKENKNIDIRFGSIGNIMFAIRKKITPRKTCRNDITSYIERIKNI